MTDLKALMDFYSGLPESVTATYQPFGPVVTEQVVRQHVEDTENGANISFGLFEPGDSICGHCFILSVNSDAPVFGIGLAECAQGQGQGRVMAEKLLAEADARGLELVTLTVLKTNTRAWSLYESLGFQRTGEATFQQVNDSFYMERRRP
jgi:ribosomal protein S18 acetylase RimI-like enzyme